MISGASYFKVIAILLMTFLLSVVFHELGHLLAARWVGIESSMVYVWPGYQVFPQPATAYPGEWPKGELAFVRFGASNHVPSSWQFGLVEVMGSGLNSMLAICATGIMCTRRLKGLWFYTCLCFALLSYDLLTYSVFPTVFNLRHFIFWGGDSAEPLMGLTDLGFNPSFALVIICMLVALQFLLLFRRLFLLGAAENKAARADKNSRVIPE